MFRSLRHVQVAVITSVITVLQTVVAVDGHVQIHIHVQRIHIHHVHVHNTVVFVVGVSIQLEASVSDEVCVRGIQMRRIEAALQKLVEDV